MQKPQTANDLRWLAETADGTRDKQLFLAYDDEQQRFVLVEANDARAGKSFGTVFTPSQGEGGLAGGAVAEVTFKGKAIDVQGADAIFLTQSAVNKFVLPYYTRFKSPAQVQAIQNKLFAQDVVIGVHFPPSEIFGVKRGVVRAYRLTQTGEVALEEEFLAEGDDAPKPGVAANSPPSRVGSNQTA